MKIRFNDLAGRTVVLTGATSGIGRAILSDLLEQGLQLILMGRSPEKLAAVEDEVERQVLFDKLVAKMYEIGKATEAAAHLEIDAVIDPADTSEIILKALNSAPKTNRSDSQRRNFVDTW